MARVPPISSRLLPSRPVLKQRQLLWKTANDVGADRINQPEARLAEAERAQKVRESAVLERGVAVQIEAQTSNEGIEKLVLSSPESGLGTEQHGTHRSIGGDETSEETGREIGRRGCSVKSALKNSP